MNNKFQTSPLIKIDKVGLTKNETKRKKNKVNNFMVYEV